MFVQYVAHLGCSISSPDVNRGSQRPVLINLTQSTARQLLRSAWEFTRFPSSPLVRVPHSKVHLPQLTFDFHYSQEPIRYQPRL